MIKAFAGTFGNIEVSNSIFANFGLFRHTFNGFTSNLFVDGIKVKVSFLFLS